MEAGQRRKMEALELMPARVKIASVIKKAIYSGEYKSGQELSLTAVAEELGVSRTPVREAFQSLAADGLITLRMNKGAIVNRIDRTFVREIFEMRILLESEAARRAALSGPDVSGLLSRAVRMEAGIETVSRAEYEDLNQQIHMALWRASGNSRLRHILMDLWNGPSSGSSDLQVRRHYAESAAEHVRILRAVSSGDADLAALEMNRHITRSMENILVFYPEGSED